jgi:hypothetical protein
MNKARYGYRCIHVNMSYELLHVSSHVRHALSKGDPMQSIKRTEMRYVMPSENNDNDSLLLVTVQKSKVSNVFNAPVELAAHEHKTFIHVLSDAHQVELGEVKFKE